MKKAWLGGAALAGLTAIAIVAAKINAAAQVGAGYVAKVACSEIFVAGRAADEVVAGEFHNIDPLLEKLSIKIDAEGRKATASLFGFGRSVATARDGYGCTLARGGAPAQLPPLDVAIVGQPWPEAPPATGSALGFVDYAALDVALDQAMADDKANVRALAVFVDGKLVAERYAPGFDAATPMLSWSMAKSVTASMVGAAVLRGLVDIDAPAPVAEWRRDGDPRGRITWRDLLQMQDGLGFEEDYAALGSDVNRMLWRSRDMGGVAAAAPPAHAPGARFNYSSGTTNLIQRTLKAELEKAGVDYHRFAYEALFAPLGAASFRLEPDASGVFVGSSFVYATARDWGRLGELYRLGGVWNGERLLPAGWPDFVAAPAAASDHQYGAQFWLNRAGEDGRPPFAPGVPEDAYMMSGHEGQYVLIAPDKAMVIVRLGQTREVVAMHATAPVFAAVHDSVGDPQGAGR